MERNKVAASGVIMMHTELLRIISDECRLSETGMADRETVKLKYGVGYEVAFMKLYQLGLISPDGPVGTIILTHSGHFAASLRSDAHVTAANSASTIEHE